MSAPNKASPTVAENLAARTRGIADVVAQARQIRDDANRAHDAAVEAVRKAEAALVAAEAAHTSNPGDTGANVITAEDALRLAQLRLSAAKKRAAEAVDAHIDADDCLKAAKVEERKARLRDAASPETLAAAIAEPWAMLLLDGRRESRVAAVAAIQQAITTSHAASAELSAMRDEYTAPLDPLHALLPGLRAIADRGGVILDLDPIRHTALTLASIEAFLDSVKVRPDLAHHVEPFKERLRRLGATRTAYEAQALERREVEAAQKARDESPEGRAQAEAIGEYRTRMSRPPGPRQWGTQ